MTPKEKAEDLWLTYYELLPDGVYSNEAAKADAKRFALIAVEEMIHEYHVQLHQLGLKAIVEYWQQVKTEIEGL